MLKVIACETLKKRVASEFDVGDIVVVQPGFSKRNLVDDAGSVVKVQGRKVLVDLYRNGRRVVDAEYLEPYDARQMRRDWKS